MFSALLLMLVAQVEASPKPAEQTIVIMRPISARYAGQAPDDVSNNLNINVAYRVKFEVKEVLAGTYKKPDFTGVVWAHDKGSIFLYSHYVAILTANGENLVSLQPSIELVCLGEGAFKTSRERYVIREDNGTVSRSNCIFL